MKPISPEYNSYAQERPLLTRRELFAAMAMQTLVGTLDLQGHAMKGRNPYDVMAGDAVHVADALIRMLDK